MNLHRAREAHKQENAAVRRDTAHIKYKMSKKKVLIEIPASEEASQ
jgi:hypothetical protein